MPRPKLVITALSSCGGCDESLLDLGERLLFELAPRLEIIYWPTAMDAKRTALDHVGPGEITATLVSGAPRTVEMSDHLLALRQRSVSVIGLGSCAHLGGLPALGNTGSAEQLLESAYQGSLPGVSPLHPSLRPLSDWIDVDAFVPGCPPPQDLLAALLGDLLAGAPLQGRVYGSPTALCLACPRRDTKPGDLSLPRLQRVHEVRDDGRCFLAQGLVCCGPATRGGCGSRCLSARMPCRGCFGAPPGARDQGTALIAALSAHAPVDDGEDAVIAYAESLVDPAGSCYRFGCPARLLSRRGVR